MNPQVEALKARLAEKNVVVTTRTPHTRPAIEEQIQHKALLTAKNASHMMVKHSSEGVPPIIVDGINGYTVTPSALATINGENQQVCDAEKALKESGLRLQFFIASSKNGKIGELAPHGFYEGELKQQLNNQPTALFAIVLPYECKLEYAQIKAYIKAYDYAFASSNL